MSIGEITQRSVQKNNNTVKLLRYKNHECYVSNINAVFQSFPCPNCDTSFEETFILEQHLSTFTKRVQNGFPRNVYQSRQALYDKLASFATKYTKEQKLFEKSAAWINLCPHGDLQNPKTTNWIGKHVPISVSISSNITNERIFPCNSDLHHLVAPFFGALENSTSRSKAKNKNMFLDNETSITIRNGSFLEKLTQRHNRLEQVRRFDTIWDDCENESCASNQILQLQKKTNIFICRNMWNDIASHNLCLVSTVQILTSIQSTIFAICSC